MESALCVLFSWDRATMASKLVFLNEQQYTDLINKFPVRHRPLLYGLTSGKLARCPHRNRLPHYPFRPPSMEEHSRRCMTRRHHIRTRIPFSFQSTCDMKQTCGLQSFPYVSCAQEHVSTGVQPVFSTAAEVSESQEPREPRLFELPPIFQASKLVQDHLMLSPIYPTTDLQ